MRFKTSGFEDCESNFHEVDLESIFGRCFLTTRLRCIGRFYQLNGRINFFSCKGPIWDFSIFYQLGNEIDYSTFENRLVYPTFHYNSDSDDNKVKFDIFIICLIIHLHIFMYFYLIFILFV